MEEELDNDEAELNNIIAGDSQFHLLRIYKNMKRIANFSRNVDNKLNNIKVVLSGLNNRLEALENV
jgi:predicted transcriptional regulator with HTH domain